MPGWLKGFIKQLKWASAVGVLALAGCSGGAVGQPVSLPVPFSGALTPDARVVVSNGDPISGGPVLGLRGEVTASSDTISWNLFNSDGSHAGRVIYGSKIPQNITKQGEATVFTVPVTFVFDDGCTVSTNEMKFYDFDYPVNAPSDPSSLQTKGVCSGVVTSGTCSFTSSIGKLIDCRYVYVSKVVNGQIFFDHINWGPWIIQR